MLFDLDATLLDHDSARDAAISSLLRAHHQLTSTKVNDLLRQWQKISDLVYERYLAGELTFAEQRLHRMTQFSTEILDLGINSDDDVDPTVAALRTFHSSQ